MVLKFFLLWVMIILGIFYIITYPYKSKLARKLKRVNSFEEIEFIKNSDTNYSDISQEEINEYITLEEKKIKSSFVNEEMKYTIITPKSNIKNDIPCLFLLHGLRDENKDWLEKAKLLENYISLLKKGEIDPGAGIRQRRMFMHRRNVDDATTLPLFHHLAGSNLRA